MNYIVYDTETTGLPAPDGVPLASQPKIIEFAAIKLDQDLIEIGRMEFLANPGHPLSDIIVKITGITDDMLKDKPSFSANMENLCDFFLGTQSVIAHNAKFDLALLKFELARLDRVTSFPWPPKQICTIEKTMHLEGYRLNLGKLYKKATGKEHMKNAHRAMADVEALTECVRWMRKGGML